MKLLLGIKVGGMREFSGAETTEKFWNTESIYSGLPLFAVARDTSKPGCIGAALLLIVAILDRFGLSKIGEFVVLPIAVNMVYLVIWPAPMHVKPCEPMCKEPTRIDHDQQVVGTVFAGYNIAHINAVTCTYQPSKEACIWIVVKNFAQSLCAKIGLSHDAHYQRIGQKPRRVCSTAGLRHFSPMAA
jgi:hypothetical protein